MTNIHRRDERRRVDTCPECGGRIVRRGSAQRRCQECGLVLHGRRLVSDRRRVIGPTGRASRGLGSPQSPARRDRGLSTVVGRSDRDARGNRIRSRKRRRLRRQRGLHRRAVSDASTRTLDGGLAEIATICGRLELGECVRETASVLFRRAREEHLLYGRPYESIAAATVYVAVRTTGVHRSLGAVVAASACRRRRIGRDARHLQRELDLAVEPPAVVEYLPAIRATLGMDERIERRARRLLEAAVESNVHSGRDPTGLAASALYTVARRDDRCPDCSQVEVAEAADVCPETIRARHEELRTLRPDESGSSGDDRPTVSAETSPTLSTEPTEQLQG